MVASVFNYLRPAMYGLYLVWALVIGGSCGGPWRTTRQRHGRIGKRAMAMRLCDAVARFMSVGHRVFSVAAARNVMLRGKSDKPKPDACDWLLGRIGQSAVFHFAAYLSLPSLSLKPGRHCLLPQPRDCPLRLRINSVVDHVPSPNRPLAIHPPLREPHLRDTLQTFNFPSPNQQHLHHHQSPNMASVAKPSTCCGKGGESCVCGTLYPTPPTSAQLMNPPPPKLTFPPSPSPEGYLLLRRQARPPVLLRQGRYRERQARRRRLVCLRSPRGRRLHLRQGHRRRQQRE